MRRLLLATSLLIVSATVLAGAQATSGNKLAWDQPATDLATAQAYTYKYYPDGATTGVVLTPVTCTGTATPFACSSPYPAFTPGSHTLTITATNIAGESAKSAPFTFTFVVVPSTPINIHISH